MLKKLILITILLLPFSCLHDNTNASSSYSIRLGNKSKIVQLKNGNTVKILSMGPFYFTNGDDPALVLTYETNHVIANSPELNDEVDEIWENFLNNVEQGGYTCGVIRAQAPMKGNIVRETNLFGFVWERLPDGSWEKMR